MSDKRSAILSLLKVLFVHSDANHHITRQEINDLLARDGISINRKTFGEHIKTINQIFDNRIEFDEKNYKTRTYYFNHAIQPAHIQLLLDALYSSHYISQKQRGDIKDSLLKSTSKHVEDEFHNIFTDNNQNARNNKSLLYVYSEIMQAIRDNKQIKFNYRGYDEDKQLKVVNPEIIVSPYSIIHRDNHPYLTCFNHAYQGERTYRADYISDIKIIDSPRIPQKQHNTTNNTYMFDGDTYRIELRIKKRAYNYFVDEFYNSLEVIKDKTTNDTYTITIESTLSGLKYMLYQFIEHIEDIQLLANLSDPSKDFDKDSLINEIIENLEKAANNLRNNKNNTIEETK